MTETAPPQDGTLAQNIGDQIKALTVIMATLVNELARQGVFNAEALASRLEADMLTAGAIAPSGLRDKPRHDFALAQRFLSMISKRFAGVPR